MKGTFYSELVKVFYTCAHADMEGNLYSTVNGVEMIIDDAIWKAVAGLDRGKETFRLTMVGGGSKCWSNGGFDEMKIKKCN